MPFFVFNNILASFVLFCIFSGAIPPGSLAKFRHREIAESGGPGMAHRLPKLQPKRWGRRLASQLLDSLTPRLLDFLTLSFVFIDILALFPRFCIRQVEESRRWRALRYLPACGPSLAVGNWCPIPRQRSAHLPICLPALAFALLDFSTVLGGRDHRQELRMKTKNDFLA
jgi:hypothetical protein